MRPRHILCTALLALAAASVAGQQAGPAIRPPTAAPATDDFAWPKPVAQNRLWTRWWWLGNAVDEKGITRQLELFAKAGLGGVEICPIYGSFGAENRYVEFLSTEWMQRLTHTYRETKRLEMAVDMTTGTGWPFGGNMVKAEDASKGVVLKVFDHRPSDAEIAAMGKGKLIGLYSANGDGSTTDILNRPSGLPPAQKFVAAIETGPMQQVKRAAPGAEGNVLDPYNVESLNKYLSVFDQAFAGFQDDLPRMQFHDSFEYYGATWTREFFDEFQKRRGYDLRSQLLALAGEGAPDVVSRVKCDYRETLSDLHLEYLNRWTAWSRSHGSLSRNQAHGGPGNLIDFYASADVPECEIFRLYDDTNIPFLKMAPSAAHLRGKKLAASESFTWLREHFTASFSDVKPAADFLFLMGVNHLFLHGIPYSPEDAAWPGWQFYASINFGPQGGLWHDMPAFSAYVARVQSILQANNPSNDVLLYMPWHDFWSDAANNDKLMIQFTHPGTWMKTHPVFETASAMYREGFSFDQVSDRLLQGATIADGRIKIGDGRYKALLIPKSTHIPAATMAKLWSLAREGGTIVFEENIPAKVPGFHDLTQRQSEFDALRGQHPVVQQVQPVAGIVSVANMGNGKVVYATKGTTVGTSLSKINLLPENMIKQGLRTIRRERADGFDYFIVNSSQKKVDNWVSLSAPITSAVMMDARFDDHIGLARIQPGSLAGTSNVYLQIEPGESLILRTFNRQLQGRSWTYWKAAGNPTTLTGNWQITFTDGGPNLPKPFAMNKLASWTAAPDKEAQRFAGTAKYTLNFNRPSGNARAYVLDLGTVADSARVSLNGKSLGTLWTAPFRVHIGDALTAGKNTLEVEVTNVAANRIRDMDQRGTQWKTFRDINVVNTGYTAFDASTWPVRDAGLLGPVTLIPVSSE